MLTISGLDTFRNETNPATNDRFGFSIDWAFPAAIIWKQGYELE